jgi:hypothetical protein
MAEWVITAITLAFGAVAYVRMIRSVGGWKAMRETRAYLLLGAGVVGFAALLVPSFRQPLFSSLGIAAAIISCSVLGLVGIVGSAFLAARSSDGRWLRSYAELQSQGYLDESSNGLPPDTSPINLKKLRERLLHLQQSWDGLSERVAEDNDEAPDLIERDLARLDEALHRLTTTSPI